MNSEELKKLIGSRIALVRKASGYSQERLGELIGVNKQTMSRWERGERTPDAPLLYEITMHCNCSADFLLGRSDVFEVKQKMLEG